MGFTKEELMECTVMVFDQPPFWPLDNYTDNTFRSRSPISYNVPELWDTHSDAQVHNVVNYEDIPSDWK